MRGNKLAVDHLRGDENHEVSITFSMSRDSDNISIEDMCHEQIL